MPWEYCCYCLYVCPKSFSRMCVIMEPYVRTAHCTRTSTWHPSCSVDRGHKCLSDLKAVGYCLNVLAACFFWWESQNRRRQFQGILHLQVLQNPKEKREKRLLYSFHVEVSCSFMCVFPAPMMVLASSKSLNVAGMNTQLPSTVLAVWRTRAVWRPVLCVL